MKDIEVYDCDGNIVEEFRILRPPFSELIDSWDEAPNIEPRFYCMVKAEDEKYYLISVYDHWNADAIRKYEHLKKEDKIQTKIKDIEEAENYEVSTKYIGENEELWYYEFNREELIDKLNKILIQRKNQEKER